jgi:hypothetical protein
MPPADCDGDEGVFMFPSRTIMPPPSREKTIKDYRDVVVQFNEALTANSKMRERFRRYYERLPNAEEWRKAEDKFMPNVTVLELQLSTLTQEIEHDRFDIQELAKADRLLFVVSQFIRTKNKMVEYLTGDLTTPLLTFVLEFLTMSEQHYECARLLLSRPEAFLYDDPFNMISVCEESIERLSERLSSHKLVCRSSLENLLKNSHKFLCKFTSAITMIEEAVANRLRLSS